MKPFAKTLLALGFATAMVTPAVAQLNVQFTFDEYGNGVMTGGAPADPNPYAVPHAQAMDPISGITTLCYFLSTITTTGSVTIGDILLYEQVGGQPVLSDIFRFYQEKLYVFSAPEAGEPSSSLADVGLAPVMTPNVSLTEGPSGATYKPLTFTDPGYWGARGPFFTYTFISDVLEPSTLALLGIVGVLLVVSRRRQSARTFSKPPRRQPPWLSGRHPCCRVVFR
jgi:hypothetical protein